MEFEFDKEMDSLLRQAARGENVFEAGDATGGHIDADEISMFAENVLPEKAKLHITKHLADCDKCRIVITNTILLNAEAEIEEAASIPVRELKAESVVATAAIPWYKNLFSTKNLAYGTGALALIFAVGIGFLFLQSSSDSALSVAQANTNSERFEPAQDLDLSDSEQSAESNANIQDTDIGNLSEIQTQNANISDSTNTAAKEQNQLTNSNKTNNLESDDEFVKDKPDLSKSPASKSENVEIETQSDENKVQTKSISKTEDLPVNQRNSDSLLLKQSPPTAPPEVLRRSKTKQGQSVERNNEAADSAKLFLMLHNRSEK